MKLDVKSGNEVVNLAGEELWVRGRGDHGDEENPREVGDLTNTEKLDLVKAHQAQVVVDLANHRVSSEAQREARETAEESKHTV